jgi:hypothetical protein
MVIKDPLLEPYFIQKDPHCYIVAEAVMSQDNPKKEKPYIKTHTFHKNFSNAVKSIIEIKLRDKVEYISLQQYVDAWEDLQSKLTKLMKKYEV